jgi:hypothetical protein
LRIQSCYFDLASAVPEVYRRASGEISRAVFTLVSIIHEEYSLMNTRRSARLAILAFGLAGLGVALADDQPRPAPVSDADVVSFVQKRVADWQPTAEERRFDEIGWCKSVLEGEKLSRETKRPLFWFTHDGKMSAGRC